VLEGEDELLSVPRQVSGAVGPGVQVAGATQRLAEIGATSLAHVVDDNNSKAMLAGEGAQPTKQSGDFGAAVLVEPVKAHKRVKNEQPWPEASDCL
jgi:hypothetical protein